MNYKIKSNGQVIYNKMTCKDLEGNIKYINWTTAFDIGLEDASLFNEEEKNFMLSHYDNLEVIEDGKDI